MSCYPALVNSDRTAYECNSKTGDTTKYLGYDEIRLRCCLEDEYFYNSRCYSCPSVSEFVDDNDIAKRTCKCKAPAKFDRVANICKCPEGELYYNGTCKACEESENLASGVNSSGTGCNCKHKMEFDLETWSCACKPTQYYNSKKELCISCPLVSALREDK